MRGRIDRGGLLGRSRRRHTNTVFGSPPPLCRSSPLLVFWREGAFFGREGGYIELFFVEKVVLYVRMCLSVALCALIS